jgi:predicted nucleic acid-binding protein
MVQSGEVEAFTSATILAEIAVAPYRLGLNELAYQYGYVLRTRPNLRLVEISHDIADRAAFLRAKYGLKTPDAIQIGAAIISGATVFLTADRTPDAIQIGAAIVSGATIFLTADRDIARVQRELKVVIVEPNRSADP